MFSFQPRLVGAPRGERAQERAFKKLRAALDEADAVVIGAGAGLSAAAGFDYTGERLQRYFGDFVDKYHFADMYSAGFFPFPTEEERWAFWSRYIWINRYAPAPSDLYERLLKLVEGKDYFVLTTNVDHQFQQAGFSKQRLFYTQGDYGLFQCSEPCHAQTYDNQELVQQMLEAQDFTIAADGELLTPDDEASPAEHAGLSMSIPAELVPHCPVCGKPMSMNLRADDTFVEDEGWHRAADRYHDFLRRHEGMRVLYLELGVGWNTPVIIKFPFWKMTGANPRATYACLNYGEAVTSSDIERQSILINGDFSQILDELGSL